MLHDLFFLQEKATIFSVCICIYLCLEEIDTCQFITSSRATPPICGPWSCHMHGPRLNHEMTSRWVNSWVEAYTWYWCPTNWWCHSTGRSINFHTRIDIFLGVEHKCTNNNLWMQLTSQSKNWLSTNRNNCHELGQKKEESFNAWWHDNNYFKNLATFKAQRLNERRNQLPHHLLCAHAQTQKWLILAYSCALRYTFDRFFIQITIYYSTCTGPAAFSGPPTPPPIIWPSVLDRQMLSPPALPPSSVRT